jgi:hypothetical protein
VEEVRTVVEGTTRWRTGGQLGVSTPYKLGSVSGFQVEEENMYPPTFIPGLEVRTLGVRVEEAELAGRVYIR